MGPIIHSEVSGVGVSMNCLFLAECDQEEDNLLNRALPWILHSLGHMYWHDVSGEHKLT